MKQEALDRLPEIREELETAVESVLFGEPDGLGILELRKRICQHPEYDLEMNMQYIHVWLAELQRDGVVKHDWDDKVYVLPRYAEKDSEAYRPGIKRKK